MANTLANLHPRRLRRARETKSDPFREQRRASEIHHRHCVGAETKADCDKQHAGPRTYLDRIETGFGFVQLGERHQGRFIGFHQPPAVGSRQIRLAGGFWRVLIFAVATRYRDSLHPNQQKHHAKKSFRQEYVELLEKFGVEYLTELS